MLSLCVSSGLELFAECLVLTNGERFVDAGYGCEWYFRQRTHIGLNIGENINIAKYIYIAILLNLFWIPDRRVIQYIYMGKPVSLNFFW